MESINTSLAVEKKKEEYHLVLPAEMLAYNSG